MLNVPEEASLAKEALQQLCKWMTSVGLSFSKVLNRDLGRKRISKMTLCL